VIGGELRAACVLWLDAAAAVRNTDTGACADWSAALHELYRTYDYGVREPLLEEAHRLLHENELRALASRFEPDVRTALERTTGGHLEFHHVFAPSSAMGLIAGALHDPSLYEQLIRIHSPEPNDPYRRAPGIHTYRALEELLPAAERSVFRARACLEARSTPHVATAAELLFALEEPFLAEQLIGDRASELDGRNYPLLTTPVETAKANGRWLAATLIWRALLDAILTRGYAKAYGHAARYLRELCAVASDIEDFRGRPTQAEYEQSLRRAHGRKTSFWLWLGDA
jgi:hypothetical protein